MRNLKGLVETTYPNYVEYPMCYSKCHNVDILLTKEVTYVSHPLHYVSICPFVDEFYIWFEYYRRYSHLRTTI